MALAEGAGKQIGPLGDRNQMNVIRHQAVAKQRDAVALRAFAESFEIETLVVVEQEDVLAIVASLRDVMRHTRRHHPGHTGHSVNEELLLSHSSGAVPKLIQTHPVRELSPNYPKLPVPKLKLTKLQSQFAFFPFGTDNFKAKSLEVFVHDHPHEYRIDDKDEHKSI